MEGRLLVDGLDAYRTYGVYVTQGGWNDLVKMPSLKAVQTNEWQEEDGIEADLSSPVLDTYTANINFRMETYSDKHISFIKQLSRGAYHVFDCKSIGRKFKLRLIGSGTYTLVRDLGLLTLKFANDFPLMDYEYSPPRSDITTDETWMIDDRPLTDYGCRLLYGTLSEITKPPEVKQNLLRNIKTMSGAIYDPARVTYKGKSVKLTCLMTAKSLADLWRNYNAFTYDLTRPNERILYSERIDKGYKMYYKSCQVQEFLPTECWLKFTLTAMFTGGDDVRAFDGLLATEDGDIVTTETDDKAISIGGN